MLTQLRANPVIRADLKRLRYIDDQILDWVAAFDVAPADANAGADAVAVIGAGAVTGIDGGPLPPVNVGRTGKRHQQSRAQLA